MSHPNASVAGVAGALAAIGIAVAGAFGLAVSAPIAAAVSTVVIAAVLFVGREGVRGALDRVWGGDKNDHPEA